MPPPLIYFQLWLIFYHRGYKWNSFFQLLQSSSRAMNGYNCAQSRQKMHETKQKTAQPKPAHGRNLGNLSFAC